jgi:excisionase family DNA binding protein
MLAGSKKPQNICVRTLEGAIYTVDEVSDLLGIPRPTLYRYLREYSIPHLRRSGRISIPEDSFDRIREARDLHKEGLGTESVRRQLREGDGPDTGELNRRLDHLHETLEDLRGEVRERPATDEVALSPTLSTILARQSLLISAMFNLTGMVEDLLLASGKPRKPLFENAIAETRDPVLQSTTGRLAIQAAAPSPASTAVADVPRSPALPDHPTRFGSLGRRRRRGLLALLSALLVGLCLVWAVPALIGIGASETSASRESRQAGASSPKTPPEAEGAKAAVPGETTSAEETTGQASRAEEDVQDAAAGPRTEAGVSVPDVSNLGLGEAAGIVSDAGLDVAVVRTEASEQEPGTVIGTVPSAGTRTEPGTSITLRVSIGPSGTQSASVDASARASGSASATASTGSSASGYASTSASTLASASASASASVPASASAGYAD